MAIVFQPLFQAPGQVALILLHGEEPRLFGPCDGFLILPGVGVGGGQGVQQDGLGFASPGDGLAGERERFAAAGTLAVTASGVTLVGVGSAFWGLCFGLLVLAVERLVRR